MLISPSKAYSKLDFPDPILPVIMVNLFFMALKLIFLSLNPTWSLSFSWLPELELSFDYFEIKEFLELYFKFYSLAFCYYA